MFYRLRRHPFPVEAHFAHCLVLTYAFPADLLEPLMPAGLEVDRYGDDNPFGFLAVALVQTNALRPAGWPRWLGKDFFLSGYRVFAKYCPHGDRCLRGLRILRSDADNRLMLTAGNVFTHYNYRPARVNVSFENEMLSIEIATLGAEADLSVVADLSRDAQTLPAGSPLRSMRDARRFAGPLPYTFDYEAETHTIVAIKGVRRRWRPRAVHVNVRRNTFVQSPPFSDAAPLLASAFYVNDIPYRWQRGVRLPLPQQSRGA
jgi:hypothetical protein